MSTFTPRGNIPSYACPAGLRWLAVGETTDDKTLVVNVRTGKVRPSCRPGYRLGQSNVEAGDAIYWAKPVEAKPAFDGTRYPLPRFVVKVTHLHEAWVVGSAADPAKDPTDVRDIDVLVPFAHWPAVAIMIPHDAKPTMFGGWKFTTDGREVDVWPGDMAWLMTNHKSKWAWQPKHGIRLEKKAA